MGNFIHSRPALRGEILKHIRSRRVGHQINTVNLDIPVSFRLGAVLQGRLSGNLQVVIRSDGVLSMVAAVEDAQRGRGRQEGGQDSEGESHLGSYVGRRTTNSRSVIAVRLLRGSTAAGVLFDGIVSVFRVYGRRTTVVAMRRR